MKLNFCTLFNSYYLSRGLALYESLEAQCKNFHLYIFAFDDASLRTLRDLGLEHASIVSLEEFEDEELLRIKPSRDAREYCWTATSSTILYCIEQYDLLHCTYLDADMYFYADPQVLIDEMGDQSVLITEHRYAQGYDQTETSGKYCVQFMTFKNDERGMKALRWWRNACLEWCYARHEDGKFGDQKYLDDWTERFEGIHVLEHRGGGVAPWNISTYELNRETGTLSIQEEGKKYPVVFFHFHGLTFYSDGIVCYSQYKLGETRTVKELLYQPYVETLVEIAQGLPPLSYNPHGATKPSPERPLTLYRKLRYAIDPFIGSLKKMYRALTFHKVLTSVQTHHYHFYQ